MVGTSETSVAPRPAAAATAAVSKQGCTSSGVPVASARVTTESPPTCAGGRQQSHLSVAGSTARRVLAARADAATASRVRTTPRGLPRRARGRDDEGVAFLDRAGVAEHGGVPVPRHDDGGAQRGEKTCLGGCGEALVDRKDRVSGVEGTAQRRQEPRVARHVQGDEPTHSR